jgi:TetR/AcrR family transcriptional regulator, mexJK operon transcriptional repressor
MPRTAEQNARVRLRRRHAILAAATSLFAQHGFAETAVSAIAAAAGVSHGAVFVYFPTKEALFRAAVLEPLEAVERTFTVEESRISSVESLRRLVLGQIQAVLDLRESLRLAQYVLGRHEQFPDLAAALFAVAERFVGVITRLVSAAQAADELAQGDPRAAALAYFAFLNGLALVNFGGEDPPYWEAMAHHALRLLGFPRRWSGREEEHHGGATRQRTEPGTTDHRADQYEQ